MTGRMAVLRIDADVLGGGPAALESAVAEIIGEAALLRLDPPWPDADRETLGTLASLPVFTLGHGALPDPARVALDLVVPDDEAAERAATGFLRAPRAAVAAALLVRTRRPDGEVFAGLVAESATYSVLQSGPEFQRWRAEHARKPDGADDSPRVRVTTADSATEIALTRPDKHNALDARMRDELHAALTEQLLASRPVIVRGDGPSFCSGGDLDEFATFEDPASAHLVRLGRSLAWRFAQLRPRLVAGLHGTCLGAGVELPAFCQHVIAADDARLGLPELGLGLVPGAGGTVSILHRCGRHRLLELLLLDGTIPADTARDWGLVDEVVPRDRLEDRCLELAASITPH
jgi:enoyl-CoA hydratase/carnithine racemase